MSPTSTAGAPPRGARRSAEGAGRTPDRTRPTSQERFEERSRMIRRRRRMLVAALLAMLVLAGVLVWTVSYSSLLAATGVSVQGTRDDAQRAQVSALASADLGKPLSRVDVAGLERAVAGIPTVASASVSRSWPHTLTVTVTPRTPVLVAKNPQGQLQVVSADGVAYETVATAPAGVPVVTSGTTAPSQAGLVAAIGALQALNSEQRDQVTGVTVSSANLVTFTLGKVTVIWGGSDQTAKKVAVLNALLATKPGYVDVSAPDSPVTR